MAINNPDNHKMPVLFIGHGSPMNAISDNLFTKNLKSIGSEIKADFNPEAILVISAHWLTEGTFVNISDHPKIIYDFGGFPDELYRVKYPAKGSPEYAKKVAEILRIKETEEWGLDHGAWSILLHLFPNAGIPVFQLSLDYYKPLKYHFDFAKKLKILRENNLLIIGSGNIVHNLRLSLEGVSKYGENFVYEWVSEFDEWVKDKINKRDFESLIDYQKAGQPAKLSVPTPDHYIPLIYCIALADEEEPINFFHEELTFGALSLRSFRIG